MSTVVRRISPHGTAALMSVLPAGSGSFESGKVKAMLLDDTSTVDTQWDDLVDLQTISGGGGYTLGEYVSTTTIYRRLALAGITITVINGSVYFSTTTQLLWTSLLSMAATSIEHLLFYVELTGAVADTGGTNPLDKRVPLCLLTFATPPIPDGTDLSVTQPTNGFFALNTA